MASPSVHAQLHNVGVSLLGRAARRPFQSSRTQHCPRPQLFGLRCENSSAWSSSCHTPVTHLGSRLYNTNQTRPTKSQHVQNLHDDAAVRSRKTTAAKRKSARPEKTTSLRRVATEAQYTRDGFIKRSGKRRFVDPEAETNQVTAYCAAEQYDMHVASRLLKQEGYDIDPFGTALYPQVIHVQTPNYVVRDHETGEDMPQGVGDIFVFPSGTLVTWNVPEPQQHNLVHRILLPAAESPHLDTVEIEDLEYLEDSSNDTSCIVGDCIILGTRSSNTLAHEDDHPRPDTFPDDAQSPEADTVLAKIAFSSGLARSAKLAVLENLLSSYFSSTRSIPTILSRGSKLRFTRSFILRKTGELLSIRAQLNLYSELTDSLPDLFWDSPSSLGLSDYYDEVGRALDVNVRIRVLNEKIDYASEIATVLRERLSEKHSTDLEWLIIFLISVEVVFELSRIWRERHEMSDPLSTDALFRDYLLRDRQSADTK